MKINIIKKLYIITHVSTPHKTCEYFDKLFFYRSIHKCDISLYAFSDSAVVVFVTQFDYMYTFNKLFITIESERPIIVVERELFNYWQIILKQAKFTPNV